MEAQLRGALLGGLNDRRNGTALAAVAREALESDALRQWEHVLDVNGLLPIAAQVTAPALYLHAAEDDLIPLAAAHGLVSTMPNAKIWVVPGKSAMGVWRGSRGSRDESPASWLMASALKLTFGALNGRCDGRAGLPAGLSEREAEVLRLLASGETNQQMADVLFISLNTVSHHLRNIFAKTGAANRTEAASFAHRHGLAFEHTEQP